MSDWHVDEWTGLYKGGWKNEIVSGAFSHPAKFSRRLIARIYEHCADEGWLSEGDMVLDPFGGVALGALDAMRLGFHWVGMELEARFVTLGIQNIALWNRRYSNNLPHWGRATLLQGDSRNLLSVLDSVSGVRAAISSPPYADGCAHTGGDDPNPEHVQGGEYHGLVIAGSISSPPYSDSLSQGNDPDTYGKTDLARSGGGQLSYPFRYGSTSGQLGAMPAGEFGAVVSSPPYAESLGDGKSGIDWSKQLDRDTDHPHGWNGKTYGETEGQLGAMPAGNLDAVVSSPPYVSGGHHPDQTGAWGGQAQAVDKDLAGYGQSDGQLGQMNEGDFDGSISSPPWEQSGVADHEGQTDALKDGKFHGGGDSFLYNYSYGDSVGQLGASQGDTFWSSARTIVAQTYAALRPGAHACWVVKDYVRSGQRVLFCDQWRQLCESVGFVTLHEHRASLVEHNGHKTTLDGEQISDVTERKSFFRRLSESKAQAKEYWGRVNRTEQAKWLRAAHRELWSVYRIQLSVKTTKNLTPTRSRIVAKAQMLAWKDAGKPRIELDTLIDHEIVFCMVKP